MPPLVPFIPLITSGIAAGASLSGANTQANAAQNAATLQTQAANHAADVQGMSAADALNFQKQQAAQDFANAQTTQKANYDQWAARQQRLSQLGGSLGLNPFNIPAYVPLQQVANYGPTTSPTVPVVGAPNSNPYLKPITQALM